MNKKRLCSTKILREVDSFKTLKKYTRIPNKYKKLVRHSKLTTFIYPNTHSFRVVSRNSNHHRFMNKFKTMYSTSANETNKAFDINYAKNNSNVQIMTDNNYDEKPASSIVKISNTNKRYFRQEDTSI